MSIGLLGGLVAYAIGGEITKIIAARGKNLIAKGAESLITKYIPKSVAASRAARKGLNTLAKTHRMTSAQARYRHVKSNEEATLVGRGVVHLKALERRTGRIRKALVGKGRTISDNLGIKRAYNRRALVGSIKDEVTYFPMTYLTYKHSQYEGTTDKDTTFSQYYAGWFPMSVGLNMGFRNASRALKVNWYKFQSGGGKYLTAASVHNTFKTMDRLRTVSRSTWNTTGYMLNRFHAVNISSGFFSGVLKGVRKMIPHKKMVAGPKTDIDRLTRMMDVNRYPSETRAQVYKEYHKNMDRGLFMKFYNKALEAGTRMMKDPSAREKGRIELSTLRLSHRTVRTEGNKLVDGIMESRELYQLGGTKFDIGHLHMGKALASIDKLVSRDFRLLNRPWLKYIDAGRSLMAGRKERTMRYMYKEASTPGYMGLGGQKAVMVGNEGSINNMINPDTFQYEDLANEIFAKWANESPVIAAQYHRARVSDAWKYFKDASKLQEIHNVHSVQDVALKYHANFIAQSREGIFELGVGESVNLITGKASIVSPHFPKSDRMFTFHHKGEPIQVQNAVSGSSRAGQLYAMLNGGGEHTFTPTTGQFMDIETRVGMPIQKYIPMRKRMYLKGALSNTLTKVKDSLEIGAGPETSLFTALGSVFTKWKDPSYFPYWIRKMQYEGLTKNRMTNLLSSNTAGNKQSYFTEDISTAVENTSKELLDDAFIDFRTVASLSETVAKSGHHTAYSQALGAMSKIIKPAVGELSEFGERHAIDFSKFAIDEGSTVDDAIQTMGGLLGAVKNDPDLFAIGKFRTEVIESVQDALLKTDLDDAWEAVSPLTRSGVGNLFERYNKTLYDTMIGIAGASDNRMVREGLSEFLVGTQQRAYALSTKGHGKIFGRDFIDRDTFASAIYLKRQAPRYKGKDILGVPERMDGEEYIDEITKLSTGYDQYMKSSKFRKLLSFRSRKRGMTDPDSAENFLLIIPSNISAISGTSSKITHIGDNVSRKVLDAPISKETIEALASVGTMNSALSFFGMGFDMTNVASMTEIVSKTITKRVLPFAGLYAMNDIISSISQSIPFMDSTPLAGGFTGLAMDTYAGTRITSAYIADFTGMTTVAAAMEDVMPGIVKSPLSGFLRGVGPVAAGISAGYSTRLGPKKGGLIGGGVGVLLGGGPLGLFGCLPGDELVSTINGFKQIADIEVGEEVYTVEGRTRKVIDKKISSGKDKGIRKIHTRMLPRAFSCTNNHALFGSKLDNGEGWMRADLLEKGDYIVFPAKRRKVRGNIDLAWYMKDMPILIKGESNNKRIFLLEKAYKRDSQYRLSSSNSDEGIQTHIWPNAKIGRFIGWYLAEGSRMSSAKHTGVSLAIDYDNEIDYVTNIIHQASTYLPFGKVTSSRIEDEEGRCKGKIDISGSLISSIMTTLCGGRSHEKRIHPDLLETISDAFILGILGGLIDGDGCTYADKDNAITKINLSTTSYHLAFDVWKTLLEFGIVSSVGEYDNYLDGEAKRKKIVLSISSRKHVSRAYSLLKEHSYKISSRSKPIELLKPYLSNTDSYCYIDGDYAYMQIKDIEKCPDKEKVYDLEIEDDASFLGFGVTYHNSWDISKGRKEVIAELTGEKDVEIRSGRWWELSSQSFWGEKVSYYRPSRYFLSKAEAKKGTNYVGNDIVTNLQSYIDPDVHGRQHYYSRPYYDAALPGSNIPIIGSAMQFAVGGIFGVPSYHDEFRAQQVLSGGARSLTGMNADGGAFDTLNSNTIGNFTSPEETAPNYYFYKGQVHTTTSDIKNPVYSSGSIEVATSESANVMMDIAGLRGFFMSTFLDSAIGSSTILSGNRHIETSGRIGSIGREYWNLELGGLLGLSEGIRRIIPRKMKFNDTYNRIPNTMPLTWMPGSGSFRDYLHADPYCVSYNTPILQQGGYTNAGEVEEGSLILTHMGRWVPVKRKIKRPIVMPEEKCYSLTVSGIGHVPLEFSEEHPLYIKRVRKRCSHGSSCICRPPVRNVNGLCTSSIDKEYSGLGTPVVGCGNYWNTSPSKFVPIKEVIPGDYLVYKIPEHKDTNYIEVPYLDRRTETRPPYKKKTIKVLLDTDFMWLLGLYLAEGSTAKNSNGPVQLIYSMNIDEIHILKKVNTLLEERFGKGGSIGIRDNSAELIVSSSNIAQVFENICPGNLYVKRVPQVVFNTSLDNKLAYIFGAYLGDATISRNQLVYKCANELLVKDLRRLCFTCGIPAFYNEGSCYDKRTGKTHRSYSTGFHAFHVANIDTAYLNYKESSITKEFPRQPNVHNFSDGVHIYQKILVKDEIELDYVYGFEVGTDNSFCSFDFATHNTRIQAGEIRLPGSAYELSHDVFYTYPIDCLMIGKGFEEQVAYYAGDITQQAKIRRNWDTVEKNRKETIGRMKRYMNVIREHDFAYDMKNNVSATIDALIEDPTGKKLAVLIAPLLSADEETGYKGMVSGAQSMLNAYLVMNEREVSEGILIGMDKDGATTKQVVHKDIKKFMNDLQLSMRATLAARQITGELEKEGIPISRIPAYSHLNRFKILADVAPFSKEAQMEMKIVREQIDAGVLKGRASDIYFDTMLQYGKRMRSLETSEYRFIPYIMGKTPIGIASQRTMEETGEYHPLTRGLGAAWEYITHLRSPITNKFLAKESAYEMYRSDVAIGRGFKTWQSPVESFIMSNASMLAAETDPVQAFISGSVGGAIFGGPIGATMLGAASAAAAMTGVTDNTRARRWEEIDELYARTDAVKYNQMMTIFNETGDKNALRKAKYTATGTYLNGEVGSYMRASQSLAPPDRRFVKRIMENMYEEDIGKISQMLPEHVKPMFMTQYGRERDYGAVTNQMAKYRGQAAGIPLAFRSEDIVYSTMEQSGYNAHDVGQGWYDQANRIRYLEAIGQGPPIMPQESTLETMNRYMAIPRMPVAGGI